jgi:hypothetical protein
MRATDDDVRAALGRAGTRRAARRAECPAPDVLANAAEGRPGNPPAGIADHVAGCDDCAFEFRLASALRPWAEGAAATVSRPARHVPRVLPLTLAASVVISLGLSAWILALQQQRVRLEARLADARQSVERAPAGTGSPAPASSPPKVAGGVTTGLAQPHVGVPLVDLFPREAARGPEAAATVDPARSPLVVVILNVRHHEPAARYAVDIADESGAPVWNADGVRPGAEPVTLAIPTHLLSRGAYRIRLHRVRDAGRALVEEYELKVLARAGSTP